MLTLLSVLVGLAALTVGLFVTRFEFNSLSDRVAAIERIHLQQAWGAPSPGH